MSAEERREQAILSRPDLHACGRGWTRHGMGDNPCTLGFESQPQRLEQRTWRLDRRISSEQTCPSYTVLFPMLEEVRTSALEQRILDRYNQANRNLHANAPLHPTNCNHPVNLWGRSQPWI